MLVAITGATGFLGRYIVRHLLQQGHACRCLCRPTSDRTDIAAEGANLEWIVGDVTDQVAIERLVVGTNAIVHAALDRPGTGFRGAEGNVVDFARRNVLGTLALIEAARAANVPRFVFVSTCAVHEVILDDRPLDETHPSWSTSHYGAHKGAIEMFVHSYGLGAGYPICAIRPTGIYGLEFQPEQSKWFGLVQAVVRGDTVRCSRGGKEVHAADVARAIELLIDADATAIAGKAFNCYDRYVAEYDVARIAKEISGSHAEILGGRTTPKHEIDTSRIRHLGMQFGGESLLRQTVGQLVQAAR